MISRPSQPLLIAFQSHSKGRTQLHLKSLRGTRSERKWLLVDRFTMSSREATWDERRREWYFRSSCWVLKTISLFLLLFCQFDDFRHIHVLMNSIALFFELRNLVGRNFWRASNFFHDCIDDDWVLINFCWGKICGHFACLRGCMHTRNHRLKNSRIESSKRRSMRIYRRLTKFSRLLLLPTAIRTIDNIVTISIIFTMFFALVAFRFVWTVDCSVAELLMPKASIDSSLWLLRIGLILYAVDRYVRALRDQWSHGIDMSFTRNPIHRPRIKSWNLTEESDFERQSTDWI